MPPIESRSPDQVIGISVPHIVTNLEDTIFRDFNNLSSTVKLVEIAFLRGEFK
ncbi:hypothetical protein B4065_2153 [Caldibacillus thermoamylovorans]|nr:hypothetical protein B4065_2153 [Caldibacillus thermoamylovorans]